MKSRKWVWLAVLFLVTAALFLPSCIVAEERDFVTYDAGRDEFRMLAVLTDIRGQSTNDLDYLVGVYRNRDHLVMPVLPGAANLFPLLAFSLIRTGDNEFSALNIFSSRPTSFDTTTTTVPLNTIKVTAGEFFVQKSGVGYYQAATVPGKTVDAALEELSKTAQTDDMAAGLQAETDRRAAGGKVYGWQDLKNELTKSVTVASLKADDTQPATEAATTEADDATPLMVLDAESLKNLTEAVKAKRLRIRREGSTLELTLPLSARDSAAATDFVTFAIGHVEKVFAEAVASGAKLDDKIAEGKAVLQFAKTISLASGANGEMTLSVDLLKFTKMIESLPHKRLDLNQGGEKADGATTMAATGPTDATATGPDTFPELKKEPSPDTADYLRKQGIALNENLTVEEIVQEFDAGTLKGHPSEKPVKPGEGIVGAATTEPAPGGGPGM